MPIVVVLRTRLMQEYKPAAGSAKAVADALSRA